MPHDVRGYPGDDDLSQQIVGSSGLQVDRIAFVSQDASEAEELLASNGACTSSRIHACVAQLSREVPPVGLDYLEKFSGQFEWFGDLGTAIDFKDALNADRTVAKLDEAKPKPSSRRPKYSDIDWM